MTYDVTGDSPEIVSERIAAIGPRGSDGLRYAAHTRSHYCYAYAYDKNPCRITAIRVTLETTFKMPSIRTNPQTASWWSGYLARTKAHEEGHRAIGVAVTKRLYHDLLAIPTALCGDMREDIARAAAKAERDLAFLNADYDRITHHGQQQ